MRKKFSIPLFKVYTDQRDVAAVAKILKSKMNWAIGPEVEAFEKSLAAYVGMPYALAFNSGTSALHAMMLAYGLGPADEVIVPSFTFIATANAPLFVGATPVFAEIEPDTLGLDPADVEKKITKKTKAIIAVHYGGWPCKIKELQQIADKHGLILLEDAAESLGAKANGKKVGTLGDSAMFSFCGPKVITTGEGGMVVTASRDRYEAMKLIRSHGRLETANYFSSTKYMDYVALGYNFRMSNILAVLGTSQMKKIEKIIAMRRSNAAYLNKKLLAINGIAVPRELSADFPVYQMYTIRIAEGANVRDALKKHLNERGIMAKVYFDPIHLTGFYRKKFGYALGSLPVTEAVAGQVLSVPMYPDLTKKEMDAIAGEITKFFNQ